MALVQKLDTAHVYAMKILRKSDMLEKEQVRGGREGGDGKRNEGKGGKGGRRRDDWGGGVEDRKGNGE